jgi:hypothetical protein
MAERNRCRAAFVCAAAGADHAEPAFLAAARPGDLGIGVLSPAIGESLSARYADRCRGAEVAAATGADFASDTDAGYSYRVFLRHCCIHLAGPDPSTALPAFPADARAARGFNGDLGQHLRRRRQRLESCERSGLVT